MTFREEAMRAFRGRREGVIGAQKHYQIPTTRAFSPPSSVVGLCTRLVVVSVVYIRI